MTIKNNLRNKLKKKPQLVYEKKKLRDQEGNVAMLKCL
jgi:hypothetical protein